MGKTSIAIEFAYARMHEYDAIFWLPAADPTKLASEFARIAKQLQLEDSSKGLMDQVVA